MFTLDTGRLHDETLALLDRLERRYQRRIQVFYPDARLVEQYVRDNGINGFYLGVEERQSCCNIRKIEPFKRAIAGHKAWVTGVRREQSHERALGEAVAWDERYGLWKVSPMLDWTEAGRVGLHQGSQPSVQPAARQRLSEHWLRALHARGRARRRSALGPLVVGKPGFARVRSAAAASRDPAEGRAAPRGCRSQPDGDVRAPWTTSPSFCVSPSEPVLVVGGGEVAARKIDLLLRTGAQVTVVAPELDRLARRARRGGDDRAPRRRISSRASRRHAPRDRGDGQARDQCVGRAPGRAPQHSGQRRRRSRAVALHRAGDRRSLAGRRRRRQQRRCAGAHASPAREARIVPAAAARRAGEARGQAAPDRQSAASRAARAAAASGKTSSTARIAAMCSPVARTRPSRRSTGRVVDIVRAARTCARQDTRAKSCSSAQVPAIRAC